MLKITNDWLNPVWQGCLIAVPICGNNWRQRVNTKRLLLVNLTESAVNDSDEGESVADKDDSETSFDAVQQLVERLVDGVG